MLNCILKIQLFGSIISW